MTVSLSLFLSSVLSLSSLFRSRASSPETLKLKDRGCSDRKVGLVRPAKGDSVQPTVLALRALTPPEARFVSRLILYFTIAVAPQRATNTRPA